MDVLHRLPRGAVFRHVAAVRGCVHTPRQRGTGCCDRLPVINRGIFDQYAPVCDQLSARHHGGPQVGCVLASWLQARCCLGRTVHSPSDVTFASVQS